MDFCPLRVVILEDEEAHAFAIRRSLEDAGIRVDLTILKTLREYRQLLFSSPPDIALVDLNLPDGRAMEILTSPAEDGPLPILIMTSYGNEQIAVEALKSGALDYFVKSPDTFANIARTIQRARREWEILQDRKKVQETLRLRLAELEVIQTVSTAMRTAQTLEEALPILLQNTLATLQADSGAIWLYSPFQDILRSAVSRGWLEKESTALIRPGEGPVGKAFSENQNLVSSHFSYDLAKFFETPSAENGWSGVCLPIRTTMETVGVLQIALPHSALATTEQLKLLNSLAEMAGSAIHRMRLYSETARHLDNLKTLHTIDMLITENFELFSTLNMLLEQIVAQLNIAAADILILDPVTGFLNYTTGRGFYSRRVENVRFELAQSLAGKAVSERHTVQLLEPGKANLTPRVNQLFIDERFTAYYGVPLVARNQVKGVLEVYRRDPVNADPDWLSFLETLAGQTAIAIDNAQLFNNLQQANLNLELAYDATIEGWSRALDLRDRETEGHTLRVTETTLRLARAMGMNQDQLLHIRRGSLLHDIGKMGISDTILNKPGPLSAEEWVIMRKHPQYAFDMLSPIAYLHPAIQIPYCHHEKWDGTGYPRGLSGEQIPLEARIFAVVDVWDALTSDRPYRTAWDPASAHAYILEQSAKHFDPQVVREFPKILGIPWP